MGNGRKTSQKLTREGMIARVKKLANEKGVRALSRRDLQRLGIYYRQIVRHFASHNALIEACGLEPRNRQPSVPNETLLAAMHDAFTAGGGVVEGRRFNRICRYNRQAYKSRWRTWTGALRAYRDWLEARPPEGRVPEPAAWKSCGGARFGTPLNAHGMQHEPINEMGVVFLFGALAPSLGYVVERLGVRFPDCIAKRRLIDPAGHWESVRIEFEYKSSNFRRHRHDAKKCDVIVCWEDDWSDCPLEVLELKTQVSA